MWHLLCHTGLMKAAAHSSVGMRELHHQTSEVLARVRRGETVEITDRGQPVAQIVPIRPAFKSPVLARLAAEGRLIPARRRGPRPRILPGDGTNRLSDMVRTMRDEERW